MKRAQRRHHKQRMKTKARRVAREIWKNDGAIAWAVRNADHLKACSCGMCCNPRKSPWRDGQGKTRKEIQATNDLRRESECLD